MLKCLNNPSYVDEALQFSATAKDYQTIISIWQIKSGFYIYRNRISFDSLKSTEDHLGQPLWPEANATKRLSRAWKTTRLFGAIKNPYSNN